MMSSSLRATSFINPTDTGVKRQEEVYINTSILLFNDRFVKQVINFKTIH